MNGGFEKVSVVRVRDGRRSVDLDYAATKEPLEVRRPREHRFGAARRGRDHRRGVLEGDALMVARDVRRERLVGGEIGRRTVVIG